MECTNLVDPHQLLWPWFTVVFVLFCIYTPDNLFPWPIVNLVGGLFWILSDSNVSLEEQIWLTECIYLADYFNRWTNINPFPQWNDICQTPGKNWTGHQKTRWSPRESKIDLRLSWQTVLGTGCRGYICKIVRIRQQTRVTTADGGSQG
jgi:hypothetical protein